MNDAQLHNLTDVLQHLARLETTLSEFYRACAETWPDDAPFWLDVAAQEQQHAHLVAQMLQLLSANPAAFLPGRPFNTTAITTVIKGIIDNTRLVLNGQLARQKALFVARDFERSVLESKLAEIVTTKDAAFRQLASVLVEDTQKHQARFDARIKQAG